MAIFLDASYLLALYNESDTHHKRAMILAEKIDANEYGQTLTSDDVFDEVISVALRKLGKSENIWKANPQQHFNSAWGQTSF